jgi:hypothetical protein
MEAKMLDIISMIIILFFLMGLPMILIIIGGSKSKSEQERAYELEEEAQYWRDYEKEKIRKIKIRRFFRWVKNFIHGNK